MEIIIEVEKYVKEKIENYKNHSEDHYDFWNEHIKYVYEESIKLAEKYDADKEIVSLGAFLHDIALINIVLYMKIQEIMKLLLGQIVKTLLKWLKKYLNILMIKS